MGQFTLGAGITWLVIILCDSEQNVAARASIGALEQL